MTDNSLTTVVNTLSDGTKVLQKYRMVTTQSGTTQVQASQPLTATMLNAQITALQSDLALLS